jgi:hypothetical protein
MKIIEQIIPAGHPNRPGVKRTETLAVVIHYTANEKPGATDTANAAYFGRKWERGPVLSGGKVVTDIIEAGSVKDRTASDRKRLSSDLTVRYNNPYTYSHWSFQ